MASKTSSKYQIFFLILLEVVFPFSAFAKKSNQSIYQDPFDLAAGGSSLTRASRDGRIFANPALMPLGAQFNHWMGTRMSVLANDGGCELAKNPCPADLTRKKSSEATDEEDPEASEFDKIFRKPVRVGYASSFSWVTNMYGLSMFSRTELEVNAKKIGVTGTPEITGGFDSYTGVQLGFAVKTPIRWWSLGIGMKVVEALNPTITAGMEILDDGAAGVQRDLQAQAVPKVGYGGDVGSLFFFQNQNVDYLVAYKIDDVANTKFKESNLFKLPTTPADESAVEAAPVVDTLTEFKMVQSVGLGLTFHNSIDQLHLALDYRDIKNVYDEPLFKRVYTGAKMTIRGYVGLAAGLYHGRASYGFEFDLFFVRLNFATFTEELSKKPGLEPRKNFLLSMSMGF
ncbi:hypothetical protein MEO40_20530 [Dolichospermum sp. ST_sed1]|nr:hypothetical protein [Dolichospermum sp. ST_sed1]